MDNRQLALPSFMVIRSLHSRQLALPACPATQVAPSEGRRYQLSVVRCAHVNCQWIIGQ